jgi:uncharacterized small protein (DUF1192 family)
MKTCVTCNRDISDYLGGRSTQCANCWEVERRLGDYLRSEAGRKFVLCELELVSASEEEKEIARLKQVIADLSAQLTDNRQLRQAEENYAGQQMAWAVPMPPGHEYDYTVHGDRCDAFETAERAAESEETDDIPPVLPLYTLATADARYRDIALEKPVHGDDVDIVSTGGTFTFGTAVQSDDGSLWLCGRYEIQLWRPRKKKD